MGVRMVQTKNAPEELASAALKWFHIAYGLGGLGLLTFGLSQMPTHGIGSRYLICVLLGFMGIFDSRATIRFLTNPRPTRLAWWYKHMECMIGCGIGFHTAFLVFGFSRLIPDGWLPGPLVLVPWLIPSGVGVPATSIWIRYYKRKFGELVREDSSQPHEASSL